MPPTHQCKPFCTQSPKRMICVGIGFRCRAPRYLFQVPRCQPVDIERGWKYVAPMVIAGKRQWKPSTVVLGVQL